MEKYLLDYKIYLKKSVLYQLMCKKNWCEWFDSTARIKAWQNINNEDINNQGLLYDRLMKQYEILGIVASLVTATLGMVLDNKNVYNGYRDGF